MPEIQIVDVTPPADLAAERMKQLILEIAQTLVNQPKKVVVELLPNRDYTVIQLKVAEQEIGKVIGAEGRTASALRTILGAASMKLRHRFTLHIWDGDDNHKPQLQTGAEVRNPRDIEAAE